MSARDCMWCGGNGQLETYAATGEVDESTLCVCYWKEYVASMESRCEEVHREDSDRAAALEGALRALAARSCENYTNGPGACWKHGRKMVTDGPEFTGTADEACYPCVAWRALQRRAPRTRNRRLIEMGYPMTYSRMVNRNGLTGNYAGSSSTGDEARDRFASLVAGDLRRLEEDKRDDLHIARYAKAAGISRPKARAVLDAFFSDFGAGDTRFFGPSWPGTPNPEAR